MYARNSTPCIDPTIIEPIGIPNKCFMGTAIKSRISSERPSKNPIILNRPILDLINSFISIVDVIWLKLENVYTERFDAKIYF